jgi:hypothetical protein
MNHFTTMGKVGLGLVYALLAAQQAQQAQAVVPSCQIDVSDSVGAASVYCAPSSFGAALPAESKSLDLAIYTPSGYQDGCKPTLPKDKAKLGAKFALLVDRSPNCTFSERAVAAQVALPPLLHLRLFLTRRVCGSALGRPL